MYRRSASPVRTREVRFNGSGGDAEQIRAHIKQAAPGGRPVAPLTTAGAEHVSRERAVALTLPLRRALLAAGHSDADASVAAIGNTLLYAKSDPARRIDFSFDLDEVCVEELYRAVAAVRRTVCGVVPAGVLQSRPVQTTLGSDSDRAVVEDLNRLLTDHVAPGFHVERTAEGSPFFHRVVYQWRDDRRLATWGEWARTLHAQKTIYRRLLLWVLVFAACAAAFNIWTQVANTGSPWRTLWYTAMREWRSISTRRSLPALPDTMSASM